jgi:hypothetical protein
VCAQLRQAHGYDRLLEDLTAKAATGWSLPALLEQLPAEKISQANDPARYLIGVVTNNARRTGPPRNGVDNIAMQALVRDGLRTEPELAERLLACEAWPRLAKQLDRAQHLGMPVDRMLANMPLAPLGRARTPAAYAAAVLKNDIAARQNGQPAHSNQPASPTVAASHTAEPLTEQLAKAAEIVMATGYGSRRTLERKMGVEPAKAEELLEQLHQHGVLGPARGDIAREVLSRTQPSASNSAPAGPAGGTLDPASPIDQIAREALTPLGVAFVPNLHAAAVHRNAAEDAIDAARLLEKDADELERDAGLEQLDPHPATTHEADPTHDLREAHLDDNLAAGYRAAAAEEAGEAAAPALRAAVVATPPTSAKPVISGPRGQARRTTAGPVRTRANTPVPERSQKR